MERRDRSTSVIPNGDSPPQGPRGRASFVPKALYFVLLAAAAALLLASLWALGTAGSSCRPAAFLAFAASLASAGGGMLAMYYQRRLRAMGEATAELLETQARHTAMLQAIPELVFVHNRDGIYLDYHAYGSQRNLLAPGTAIGRNVRDVLPESVAQRFLEAIANVLERCDVVAWEYEFQQGGTQRQFEARSAPCRKDRVLTMVREVTDRRAAEQALSNSESEHRTLFERIPDPVLLIDQETNLFVDFNPAAVELFGYSKEDLLTLHPWDLHPAEIRAETKAMLVTDSSQVRRTARLCTKDGREIWAEIQSSPVMLRGRPARLAVLRDITERKRAEDELRLTQFAVDRSQDTIFWIDCDGRILYVNEAASVSLGYSREQLMKMTVADLDPNFPQEAWPAHWEKVRAAPRVVSRTTHRRADGTTYPIEVTANYLAFEGRELDCAVARDISERLRAEREVQEHAREIERKNLELSEALAAAREATELKSMFLANMSHELRTPMNGVLGMLAITLDTTLSPEQADYLQTARASAESMLALLDDILDLSRVEAGKLEVHSYEFRPAEILAEAIRMLSLRAKQKGLDLSWHVSSQCRNTWLGDPVRLRQVLVNLIGNAIKFTDSGFVRIHAVEENTSGEGCVLRFSIADSGIGVPPAKHEKIFKAFEQADGSVTRKHGGAGLGLAISAKLVHLMNGQIWLESTPGKGSTFHFTVAVARPAINGVSKTPEAAVPEVFHTPPLNVLIAEDNPVNQKVLERLLAKEGHAVSIAGNGRLAVSLAGGRKFDLILMDVQMPELDGLAATRIIRSVERQTGAHVPIIALTAHAMQGDRERCLAAGVDAYLSKPVSRTALTRTIQQVLPPTG